MNSTKEPFFIELPNNLAPEQWRGGSTLAGGAQPVLAPPRKLRLLFVVRRAEAIQRLFNL